ncbi:LacI family DNA-binding transcriptional regulator [Bauldia sp.]|uniref:LacI family DNA-binding transcriptional regulator n=1 Tax=Bauldia sp. TaxID=2575872 RepID=UPI003BAAC8DA
MTTKRVTMQMLAEATGLSKFAVSRALSDKPGVSEATRKRVHAAATELGYRKPTPAHRRTIGLLFDDVHGINSELQIQLQSGARREAERLGFDLRVHWTSHRHEYMGMFADCVGLIVSGVDEIESVKKARSMGIPVVRLGFCATNEDVDMVGGAGHEAGAAVAEYLLGFGHREIAYVHGPPTFRGRFTRFYGLQQALEEIGGCTLHHLTWTHDNTFRQVLEQRLDGGAWPTAYFCSHDGLAVTVVSELLSRGLKIPDDVSVMGFGDFAAATQVSPPLTTVRVNGEEEGATAVKLLRERISGERAWAFPMRLRVLNTLIERDTVGPRKQLARPTAKPGRPRRRAAR